MEVEKEELSDSEAVGCLGFGVGFLSFIPGVGVIFGIIGLIWGLKTKNKFLKYSVLISLLFNILFLSYTYYKQSIEVGGEWDATRALVAKQVMYKLVDKIERHKEKNIFYPKSLKTVAYSLPKLEQGLIFDPTLWHDSSNRELDLTKEENFFYYEILNVNEGFHLRARGRDGVFGTEDDVLIEPVPNTGFVHDHPIKERL
jgi:hypothetical protein